MKPVLPVLLAAGMALLLSGCLFGYPEGAARPGDAVSIQYTATDAKTGEVLAQDEAGPFPLGSGGSGFGEAFEARLVGKTVNETISYDSPATDRQGTETLLRSTDVPESAGGTIDRFHTVATATINGALRTNVTVGTKFAFGQDRRDATVTATDAKNTTFEIQLAAPIDVPQFGLRVVEAADGDKIRQHLEPMVGTEFTTAQGLAILELPPGSYKVLDLKDGQLQFLRSPSTIPGLAGHDVHVEAKILTIKPGAAPTYDPEGNVGARQSPVVLGHAATGSTSPAPVLDEDAGHEHAH